MAPLDYESYFLTSRSIFNYRAPLFWRFRPSSYPIVRHCWLNPLVDPVTPGCHKKGRGWLSTRLNKLCYRFGRIRYQKKLFISGWFDRCMVIIPSDQWFSHNHDFSKNMKLQKIYKILQNFLKVSMSIHISIFFRIILSKSVQGKCVDHLTCLKISVWQYLIAFLRLLPGKIRRFQSWIIKS